MKIKLTQLDSAECEEFIDNLYKYSSEKLSSIVPCFQLRAPKCLHEMSGLEATRIIAFGAGARSKAGITNAMPITIEDLRNEQIADTVEQLYGANHDMPMHEKIELAKERLWPADAKGVRERDRGNYNKDADAIFAYAEGKMSVDVRTLVNTDEAYSQAKADRCVVGFLEALRAKCAIGTTNVQANREALEARLRTLFMEDNLNAYVDYKNNFIKIVNSLKKCIDPMEFNEEEFINKFLAKLDQSIFGEPYYKRVGPEASHLKEPVTMEAMYQKIDEIYDAKKTTFIMTKRPKTEANSDAASAKGHEANVFLSEDRPRKHNNNASFGGGNSGNSKNHNSFGGGNSGSSKSHNPSGSGNSGSSKNHGSFGSGTYSNSNGNHDNNGSGSANNNNKKVAKEKSEKKNAVCDFYIPGNKGSCRYGDTCKKTHVEDLDYYNRRKALLDQLKKLNEDA